MLHIVSRRALVAAFVLVLAVVGPAVAAEPAAAPTAWTVGIDGMTCPDGCAPTVKSKLESVDGVERVEVDFANKAARVTTKPGAQLTQAACAKALEGTPYTVSRVDPPAAQ